MIRRLVAERTGEPADVLSVAELPDDPPPVPVRCGSPCARWA